MMSWATMAQVALLSSSTALAFEASICLNAQFGPLSCLKGMNTALEACASLLPAQTKTCTETMTATAGIAKRADCPGAVTVSRTNIESSTSTVTTGPLSTVTAGITQMNSFATTLTTYMPSGAVDQSQGLGSSVAPSSQLDASSLPSISGQPSRAPDQTSLSPALSAIAESILSSVATRPPSSTIVQSSTVEETLPAYVAPSSANAETLSVNGAQPSIYARQAGYGYAQNSAPAEGCNTLSALLSLGALYEGSLNTACACLGVTAFPTRSITITTTEAGVAQLTTQAQSGYGAQAAPSAEATQVNCNAGSLQTSTAYFKQRIVYTETVTIPAPTITLSTTDSETATATITLVAPIFTQVFGPKAGCADVATNFTAQQLPNEVTEEGEATKQCQDMCTQQGDCQHVFVQHMFTDYGSATPYYECFFNEEALMENTDIECGRREGTYGTAVGYDAIGRGKQSGRLQ